MKIFKLRNIVKYKENSEPVCYILCSHTVYTLTSKEHNKSEHLGLYKIKLLKLC
jgi:hypothetical protein